MSEPLADPLRFSPYPSSFPRKWMACPSFPSLFPFSARRPARCPAPFTARQASTPRRKPFPINSSRQPRHFGHRLWGSVTDAQRDRCFHLSKIQHAVPGILATARRADSTPDRLPTSLESPRLHTVTPDRLFPTLWIRSEQGCGCRHRGTLLPTSRSTIEGHKR
jgi:hypothetical protein